MKVLTARRNVKETSIELLHDEVRYYLDEYDLAMKDNMHNQKLKEERWERIARFFDYYHDL